LDDNGWLLLRRPEKGGFENVVSDGDEFLVLAIELVYLGKDGLVVLILMDDI
jgi:hypothetical protein